MDQILNWLVGGLQWLLSQYWIESSQRDSLEIALVERDRGRVAVVVSDGAPLFEAAIPLSVFGVDRSDSGGPRYSVVAVTAGEGSATTTAGIRISGLRPLYAARRAGILVVSSWRNPEDPPPYPLLEELRRAHQEGAIVVGLCLGAFVLAAAGLLDYRRATTHWRWVQLFARMYPQVEVDSTALYVDEGRIMTSAGTAAGLDACLYLIRREQGAAAAAAVARRMIAAPHRSRGQAELAGAAGPDTSGGSLDGEIGEFLSWLSLHLEQRMTVEAMARRLNISRRAFDRTFRATTGTSPLQWILRERVVAAQQLLETTDFSIEMISMAVGFGSSLSLRTHFKRLVGVAPQSYREAFAMRGRLYSSGE